VTLDRLAEHGPHPGRLLRTIAWWAPDGISMQLLRASTADEIDAASTADEIDAASTADEMDVDDAVGRLAAYALVARDGDTISVHRLVQAANRAGPDDYRRSLAALHHAWETGGGAPVNRGRYNGISRPHWPTPALIPTIRRCSPSRRAPPTT
jgi:hypothetical protein